MTHDRKLEQAFDRIWKRDSLRKAAERENPKSERMHCKSWLHLWCPENVARLKNGKYYCRLCRNAAARRLQRKKKAARA